MEPYPRLRRLTKLLLLTFILLLPLINAYNNLVVASFAYKGFGFEQAKIFFFILSISLIGFIWLFQKPKLEWNLIRLTSFIFILILFISSVLGVNPQNSILGINPYFQGLIIYGYLFIFSLIVSTTFIKTEYYAIILASSAIWVSVLALKDWVLKNIFLQEIPNYAGRVISSFGQPNFYGGFLLLTLPFSYLLLKNSEKRLQLLGWGSGLISFLGIWVSYSRIAILLSLILLSFALIREIKIKKLIVLIIIALLGAISVSIISSSGLWWSEWVKLQNPVWLINNSPEKRLFIWPVVFQLIKQKPLIGYGLENISPSFSQYFIEHKHALFEENLNVNPVLLSLKDLNLDRTHNYILDLFLFSGVLGVMSWLVLVVIIFWKFKQTKYDTIVTKNVLLVSFITYLIWVQFQNQSIVHLLYFWLIVGLTDQD